MTWQSKKLGNIATFINGKAFKPSDWSDVGFPIIRIQNLTNSIDDIHYYNGDIEDKYRITTGDILISWSATIDVFEWLNGDAVLNQHIFKVVFDKEPIDKTFFKHLIKQKIDEMLKNVHGSTMKHITKGDFDNIDVLLPSLDEQKKIAKILDKADEIRTKKKLANDKLDEFLKSTFISMFGDPIKNEKNYRIEKLQNVTKFLTDGKHGDCEDEDNSGYYFVSAKCINNGKIDLAQARQIKYDDYKEVNKRVKINVGDLLIVNTGATIGKMAIIRDEGLSNSITLQKSVAVINMDNDVLNSEYLSHCLLFKSMAKVSAGSAIHNLLLSTMRAYELPIPPIEDQNKFAQIVEHVEAQKQKNELVIEQMNNLFNSLSQRAFKGEI